MAERQRPLIFVGNDDGYQAGGLKYLSDIARQYGDVFVAAPTLHQSGKSSALTVDTPLRARLVAEEAGFTMYHVNGTPVDCIKLALNYLVPRQPDIVLSGINHGYNSGNSAIYSGTMGVTFEGSFLGVPSIGFSYGDYGAEPNFSPCEPVVRRMIELAIAGKLPTDVCYNVNIPKCDKVNGTKVVAAAPGRWIEEYDRRTDPHGRAYYWLTGRYVPSDPDNENQDLYWLQRGYATVVPCRADQTARDFIPAISEII